MEVAQHPHITKTPNVCGGKPCIAGHRIRVQDVVVWHELHGQTPEEIVADFPQITLADVHAALCYYYDHMEQIREDLKAAEEVLASARARHPSKLLRTLLGADAHGNPLSPR